LNESLDHADDLAVLDEVASLSAKDIPDFDALRSCYESDPRLRVNGSLLSYVDRI